MRRLTPLSLFAWASARTSTLFDDLPLRDFVKPDTVRHSNEPSFLLAPLDLADDDDRPCLRSSDVNMLLEEDDCVAEDGMRWVFNAPSTLQLAHDVSLCLDVFSHASSLGVYWCHGGANQQFHPRRTKSGVAYCATVGDDFCVIRASATSPEQPASARRPLGEDERGTGCRPDSLQTELLGPQQNCAAWAAVGECHLSSRYMRQHCETTCAQEGAYGCRLEDDT